MRKIVIWSLRQIERRLIPKDCFEVSKFRGAGGYSTSRRYEYIGTTTEIEAMIDARISPRITTTAFCLDTCEDVNNFPNTFITKTI